MLRNEEEYDMDKVICWWETGVERMMVEGKKIEVIRLQLGNPKESIVVIIWCI